jgi:hypothetical protein
MINLQFSDFNIFAIFAAWLIHVVSGLIWFQPKLFGNEWSRLTGKELKPAPKWILPGCIGHLCMVLVLLMLIKLTGLQSGFGGLLIGLMTWVGFIVPMEIGELIWEKIPFKLFLIRISNQLIGFAISGYILGAWQ